MTQGLAWKSIALNPRRGTILALTPGQIQLHSRGEFNTNFGRSSGNPHERSAHHERAACDSRVPRDGHAFLRVCGSLIAVPNGSLMKAPPASVRIPGEAKPKAKGTSRASKPGKSATKSKSPPKAGAKAKAVDTSREQATGKPASRLIDQRIRDLGGWRGETLARMRALILAADPEMTEECKWIKPTNPLGVPVWSHTGIVCTGEAYTNVVKLTFARGARIADPSRLFNSSLEGNTRRAIDIHEGEKVDAGAFKALVKAAVAQNGRAAKR
jgi:hypothetical protein